MRALLAGLLLLSGGILVPVATTAWWLRTDVESTQGYVETVTPLATAPAVQHEVERLLVAATMDGVRRSGVLARVEEAFSDPGLPADSLLALHQVGGSVEARVHVLVRRAVDTVVTSRQFVRVWRSANRSAHEQLVRALRGDSSALRVGPGATVDVRLAPLSGALEHALARAGVPFASLLPRLDTAYPLGTVRDLHRARRAYAVLDAGSALLPAGTAVLLAAGLLLASRRRRALGWTAALALLGLGVAFLGLLVSRGIYVHAVPTGLSTAADRAVFDVVTVGLRSDLLRVALAAAVLLALAVLLPRTHSSGPRQELLD